MPFLNLRVVSAILGLAVVLGVLNNFRVPVANRVTWFGGQQILEKPADLP